MTNQSKTKPKATEGFINTKAFIGLMHEQDEVYLKYEIEDMLRLMTTVLQNEISKGNSVKIQGLGVFKPKDNASKNCTLPSGERIVTQGSTGVSFKPDVPMLRAVNQGTIQD